MTPALLSQIKGAAQSVLNCFKTKSARKSFLRERHTEKNSGSTALWMVDGESGYFERSNEKPLPESRSAKEAGMREMFKKTFEK